MILVSGFDRAAIAPIASALGSDSDVERLDPPELDLAALLARTREQRPALVLVDALRRLRGRPPEPDLVPLVRAAAAAGLSKLVLVTSRPADDPALVALRRSGVPYDVVSVDRLALFDPALDSVATKLIASSELAEAISGSATIDDVIATVTRALERDSAGATLAVEPERDPLAALDQQLVTGRVKSWWSRLLGRPSLAIDAAGSIAIASPAAAAPPERAAAPAN